MGLTIHYDLSLPAETTESEVLARLTTLRREALALPFEAVSELVRFVEADLDGPSPIRGLSVERLEDVVNVHARFVRDELYRESIGVTYDEAADDGYFNIEAPEGLPVVVLGFTVAPGVGSEPAAFALARLSGHNRSSRWLWRCFCKTQYASAKSEEHFLTCHTSLISLLDSARRIGIEIDVRDEGGFFEHRDEAKLLEYLDGMNLLIAKFAGRLSDAFTEAGGDTRQVQGEIFRHPDFERLETRGLDRPPDELFD
jgi:hypothetical protein